jgi:hypothetical protein
MTSECDLNAVYSLEDSKPPPYEMTISARRSLVEENIRRASTRLQKRLHVTGAQEIEVDLSSLDTNCSLEVIIAQLSAVVDGAVSAQYAKLTEDVATTKAREIMKSWLRASYPFIQIIVGATRAASNVSSTVIALMDRLQGRRSDWFVTDCCGWRGYPD